MKGSITISAILCLCIISSAVTLSSGYNVNRSPSSDLGALYSLMEKLMRNLQVRQHSIERASGAGGGGGRDMDIGNGLLDTIDDRQLDGSRPKRRWDAGYASRYQSAARIGAKIMALKEAADWNGPGRRRRRSVYQRK